MPRFLLALVACVLCLVPAAAAPPEPLATYALPNGLQVVLAPDKRVPKVVVNVRYRVGSLNEPAGRSGFAHLFEHLMFSGTSSYPDIDVVQLGLGTSINAWTMEDGTLYYSEGLASSLPVMLSIEADRMANLGAEVDQAELDLQRSVVKNEMRQNFLDSAGTSPWTAFWTGMYPDGHPYSRAVIGSIADLDAATLDDVRGFFDTYYVPNNATLAVVGDFDVEDARGMIAATFGLIPRGAEVAQPQPPQPAPTRFRAELEDRLPSDAVFLGMTGPTASDPRNGPLSLAAELLGNLDYGFLRQRLVVEQRLASAVYVYWTPGVLGGRFTAEATAAPGATVEHLEAGLRSALAEFAARPVPEADLERARRSLLLTARLEMEPLKERTESVAWHNDVLGDPAAAFADDPAVAGATPGAVQAALRDLGPLEDAAVVVVRRGSRGGYPDVLTESSGAPEPFATASRPPVGIPRLGPAEPGAAALPAAESATLSNGIVLHHYRLPDAPMTYIAAAAEGGWSSAPAGREGLLDLATYVAYHGAGGRDFPAFAKAAADIGASIGYQAAYQATMMTLAVPPDAIQAGVDLLADAVRRPRFDAAEWALAVESTTDTLLRREGDIADVARRSGEAELLAPARGRPAPDWSLEALQNISLDEAKAAFGRLFTPQKISFYSVGPQPLADLVPSLERGFGQWSDGGNGYEAVPYPEATLPDRRRVLLVPEPGASQAALYIARPAPGRDQPDRHDATAVMRLLGADFTSRLNSVIREEKGYTYGVDAELLAGPATGSALVVTMTVDRDNAGAALAEVFKGFDSLRGVPVSQEELDRTITAYLTSLAGQAETAGGLFGELLASVGSGRTLEQDHAALEAKTRLQLAPVRAEALELASLDRSIVVVVGDPGVVAPQLAAIGLTEVETVERTQVAQRMLDLLEEGDMAVDQERPSADAGPAQPPAASTRGIHDCGSPQGCVGQLATPRP